MCKMSRNSGGGHVKKWRYADQMMFLRSKNNSDASSIASSSINSAMEGSIREEVIISTTEQISFEEAKFAGTTLDPEAINALYYWLNMNPKDDLHPVEHFFLVMGKIVKNFNPLIQNELKTKIFAIISELEHKYLTSNSAPFE